MDKTGEKGSFNAEQTSEYRLLSKLGQKFPRLRQTLLDLFSIDLRTLALTRVAFALIVLVDLLSRLSDLKVFYTDGGVMPRAAVHENLPDSWFISLHFLSGRAEIEMLMFVISGTLALLLLLGYKTRLVSFLTWLLFSSLCIRNPFIVHGADDLLKMMLFWGIFVPWGVRYSVDSSINPTPGALPQKVFSVGTMALLLQMPLVYFFSGILKNGLEWRHDFTAILYALKVPDFALPLGTWLTSYPGFLKVVTASTLVLEMAGALLLFCPFRTKTVRGFVIVAFVLMQLGLALTLTLGLFPLISIAALLPFIASSFWDRLFSSLRTSERTGLRIYYDANCGFCKKSLRLIKTFFLLPETRTIAAQSDAEINEDMVQHNSWVVIDSEGKKHYKFEAFIELLRVAPLLWPIAQILQLDWIKSFGTWIYDRVANNRGWLSRATTGLRYRRLSVRMPLLLTVFCALCLIYVVVDNFGSVARSPIRIPARVAPVGQLLNLRQNWRLFAPTPLRVYTWYVVEGRLRDGRSIDLWTGQPVTFEKPANPQPSIKNVRWRPYMRYLTDERQRSLRPYFVSYVCRSWNESHQAGAVLEEVTVFSLDEPISLDGSSKEIRKTVLWQQVCEPRKESGANPVSR